MTKSIKIIISICLLASSYSVHSSTPVPVQVFNNLLGGSGAEVFNCVKQTSDGGYITVGYTTSWGSGMNDVLVAKFSSSGVKEWVNTYGTASDEQGFYIEPTGSGSYLIGANTSTTVANSRDILVIEIDANGTVLWKSTYGTSLDDRIKCIRKCPAGGYIICGDVWDFSASGGGIGSGDYLVIKLDDNKAIQWQNKYYVSGQGNFGDIARDIIPSQDGGFVLSGGSYRGQDYEQVMIKITATGSVGWNTKIGRNGDDAFVNVQELSDGSLMAFGILRPAWTGMVASYPPNINIAKFNSTGSLQWCKEYGNNDVNYSEIGNKGIVTANGDLIVIGESQLSGGKDALLLRTDANGNLISSTGYGGILNEIGYDLLESDDNGFVLSGLSSSALRQNDAYMIRTDHNGNTLSNCNLPSLTESTLALTASSLNFLTVPLSFTINSPVLTTVAVTVAPNQLPTCNVDPCLLNPIDFTGLPTTFCPNAPAVSLVGTPLGGTYSGTGISGNSFNPSTAGAGIFTITYTVPASSVPATCPRTISKKTLVMQAPKFIDRVLSASATTFSDTWPIDFTGSASLATLQGMDEVSSGTKGVWRAEESYVYVDDRQKTTTPQVNLKEDGIFNNMPLFDYTSGMMGGCFPNWRKVNTITEYNTNSYEIENKDILNNYSSALFGYNGDMAIAVAVNAQENEVAYESFEEYTTAQTIKPIGLNTGNLAIYNTAITSSDYLSNVYREIEVVEATDNTLTVAFPSLRASELQGKTINVFGSGLNTYNVKDIYGSYTVASATAHATDPAKTVVALTSFPYVTIWKGKVTVPYSVGMLAGSVSGSTNASIVTTKSHTGKQSLKTTATVTLPQHQLVLKIGADKKYVFNAWVSTDVTDVSTYLPATGSRGVNFSFLDASGSPVASTIPQLNPSGNIIEGWQRIQGEFSVPDGAMYAVMQLSSTVGITYWDDIRLFPFKGNMKTYVYNKSNYKVSAALDENNYATLYYYDDQGNLFLLKKETERGIMTIQESFSHQHEKQ